MMLIYINGDSFASGAELCDATFFKEAPGLVPMHKREAVQKKWMPLRNKLFQDIDWDELIVAERKEAWGQILCDMLGAECVNGAMGGSSMMGILIRTTNDLLALKQQGKTPDHVFIQITGTHRTSVFDEHASRIKQHMVVKDLIISASSHIKKGDPVLRYLEGWVMAEDDTDRGLRWLHLAFQISSVVEAMTGKKPIFVDSLFGRYEVGNAIEYAATNPMSKLIIDALPPLLTPELAMCFYHNEEEGIYPGNHYSKTVHERFAKALKEMYFKDTP